MLDELKERFLNYNQSLGFHLYNPFPLVINDPTILFTNSTVAPFKKMFTGESERRRFALIQPCLRMAGSAGDLDSPRTNLNYTSLFDMIGSGFFDVGYEDAIDYFVNLLIALGIDQDQLLFTSLKGTGFSQGLLSMGVSEAQVYEFPRNSSLVHEWSFGEGDLHGHGVVAYYVPSKDILLDDIDILNKLPSCLQLGRLVHLDGITQGEEVIKSSFNAFDVGIGLNRIEMALTGNCEESLLPWRQYAQRFQNTISSLSDGDAHYLANLFHIISLLIQEGLRPGKKKQEAELKKLIRLMIEEIWCQKGELSTIENDLRSIFELIEKFELIQSIINEQEKAIHKILKNAGRNISKKADMTPEELKSTFGIRPRLVKFI